METITCEGCRQQLPCSEFNKSNGGHGHGKERYPYCKACCSLRVTAANIAAERRGMSKNDWVKSVPYGERISSRDAIFQELVSTASVTRRDVSHKPVASGTKQCVACHLVKSLSEFSDSCDHKDGKQHFCIVCHRLRHHSYTIAARQVGLSTRKWMHSVPKAERMSVIDRIFKDLVRKHLESLGLPADVNPHDTLSLMDPLLNEVRSRHAAELSKLDNRQVDIPEGFVYAITNPAWEGCVKIGSAWDYESRLNAYQTYGPYRDYRLEHKRYSPKRREMEEAVKSALGPWRVNGEWFRVTVEHATSIIDEHAAKYQTT